MAITTTYRGIEYRSRLEARWAAFFSRLGWAFTYEPFDGDGYIPDFLIAGDRPLFVEVKPATTRAEYDAPIGKVAKGLAQFGHDILIVGASPTPQLLNSFDQSNPPAGVLGEFDGVGYAWGVGNWAECTECLGISVFHDQMTYACRPCAHYEGDHFLGAIKRSILEEAWAYACNEVKWRGRQVDRTDVVPLHVVDRNALPPKRLA